MSPFKWKGTLGQTEEMTRIFGHVVRKPAQDLKEVPIEYKFTAI
jgi:hypothetical protein